LIREDLDALRVGAVNLQAHIDILRRFGVPVVVAINRHPTDTAKELAAVRTWASEFGASQVAVTEAFAKGGEGSIELAEAVIHACSTPGSPKSLYPLTASLRDKFETVACQVYGAAELVMAPEVERRLERLTELGYGTLPVCIAKTQYSLSHDPTMLGRPTGFRFPITDVRASAGAGFVYGLAGDIMTMPGLPSKPAALRIDLNDSGKVIGI
jgi:formyltetrahydrofolate synthetase